MSPYWTSGDVTLYCGDCLEIMPQLEAGSVDAVVTDPPYGIDFDRATWPDKPSDYGCFIRHCVDEWNRLVIGGPVFVWQSLTTADGWHDWFPKQYRIFASCNGFVQFRPTPVQWSWNPVVWWGQPSGKPSVYKKDYHVQLRAPFGACRPKIQHPTLKAVEQMAYVVEIATQEDERVLDSFMGSGTTGVACVNLGRRFIGIDISEEYCAMAVRRIKEAQTNPRLPLEVRP